MTIYTIILAIACYIILFVYFYTEIKKFIKDKKELNDAIVKAMKRQGMNIDVK